MTLSLEKGDISVETHRTPCEDKIEIRVKQQKLRNAEDWPGNHQKQERHGMDSPSWPTEGPALLTH